MLVFSIVNRTIDLGEEIVAANNFGTPSTYRDIFFLLYKNKFIEENMFKKISYLVYVRNLIAHEYHKFEERDIFKAVKKLPVVKKFVETVKSEIKKT